MKKIYMIVTAFVSFAGFSQTDCNTIVINDLEEQNAWFITGPQGPKAAADIPIGAGEQITISHIRVTLGSAAIPEFIHFRFYANAYSVPADPEDQPQLIPGEVLFDFTATTVGEFDDIAYDNDHELFIRNYHVNLTEPIVLSGDLVDGRFWMGVISDASYWNCTSHIDTGEGVVGEQLAFANDQFDWFQLNNMELLYELTAECGVLGTPTFDTRALGIYPNPASEVVNISLGEGIEITKTEMYTVTGQLVMETAGSTGGIPVAGLASGVYIIKAQAADNTIYNGRFVKN